LLQYGAQAEPDRMVRVLVRKTSSQNDSRDIVAHTGYGANVKGEFSAFNTSSIQIKQKDVLALATDPRVVYVSPDGDVGKKDDKATKPQEAALKLLARTGPRPVTASGSPLDGSDLLTTYPQDVKAPSAWQSDKGSLTGAGVTVAVLDTGVNPFHPDLDGKVFPVFVNPESTGYLDELGHGTHVIGIINGRDDNDQYVGIAPDARVISVKIENDKGQALESDMLRGLLWVFENHTRYNIKVLNLSLGASTPQSYRFSPIDAAVELLWQQGVTVIASSGNRGTAQGSTWAAPGNDPFVITVGCLDDNQTLSSADDSVCSFSSRGTTQDGVGKPNIVAPGRRMYSVLSGPNAAMALQYPDRISPDRAHIRMSGTSMATPVVAGAAALILQRYPQLQPNQLKWLLGSSAKRYRGQTDGAGELDIAAAIEAGKGVLKEANTDLKLGPLLSGGIGSVATATAYWDEAYWDHAYWDTGYWDHAYWDEAYWGNAYWDTAGAID
jgi:serine protease AprX